MKRKHWPWERSRQIRYKANPTTACAGGGKSPEFASRVDEVTCLICAYEVDHTRWWWGGGEPPPFAMCGYCGERLRPEDEQVQMVCRRCIVAWSAKYAERDPAGELLIELIGINPTPIDPKEAEAFFSRVPSRESCLPPSRRGPGRGPGLLERTAQVRAILARPRLRIVG